MCAGRKQACGLRSRTRDLHWGERCMMWVVVADEVIEVKSVHTHIEHIKMRSKQKAEAATKRDTCSDVDACAASPKRALSDRGAIVVWRDGT